MPQYSKTTWVNDNPPAIDAERLNKIENGIFDALPKDGSVAMTGQLVTTAGSAATPAIAPTGDSNTGIFFPAADNLGLAVGGGEGFRLLANGNVGLSQGNPSVRLALGAVGGQKFNLYDDPSSGIGIGMGIDISGIGNYETTFYSKSNAGGNGQWVFGHLNSSNTFSEKMRLNASGNLGIGTTNPSEKMVVNGNISSLYGIHSTTLYNGNLNFYNAGSATKYINVSDDSSTIPAISLDKIGSATKTCFLNGNVGIGTTSPNGKLQVGSSSDTSTYKIFIEGSNTADTKAVFVSSAKTSRHFGIHTSTDNFFIGRDSVNSDFTISSTGNIGIGTTSPNIGLYGATAKVVTVLSSTGFGVNELASSATPADSNVLGVVSFINNGSGIITPVGAQIIGVQSGSHASYAGGKLIFYTRANGSTSLSERLTITDSGNVGIGTTSSTWGSGYTAVSLKNAGNSISSSGASQLLLSSNAYDSGAGAWKYTDNGYFANLMEIGSNGYLFYTTQSTQGAGNPITWSERMRITSAGNVGIGTTSPAVKFVVESNQASFGSSMQIINTGTSHGQRPQLAFYNGNTANPGFLIGKNNSGDGGEVFLVNEANTAMLFITNGITRLSIEAGGTTRPFANNTYDLGSSTYRWATIYAQNALNTSDARLKTNVEPSSLGLDFINQLNPVQYRWIEGGNTVEKVQTGTETVEITPAIPAQPEVLDEDGNVIQESTQEVPAVTEEKPIYDTVVTPREGVRTHFGLIAQEVKAALPNGLDFAGWCLADKDDADSTQSLGYTQLIAPMIKAIQELNAKVEALEAQLNK